MKKINVHAPIFKKFFGKDVAATRLLRFISAVPFIGENRYKNTEFAEQVANMIEVLATLKVFSVEKTMKQYELQEFSVLEVLELVPVLTFIERIDFFPCPHAAECSKSVERTAAHFVQAFFFQAQVMEDIAIQMHGTVSGAYSKHITEGLLENNQIIFVNSKRENYIKYVKNMSKKESHKTEEQTQAAIQLIMFTVQAAPPEPAKSELQENIEVGDDIHKKLEEEIKRRGLK